MFTVPLSSRTSVVSIICPAFNEEAVLPLFHEALTKTLRASKSPNDWEIIYVDDGSTDGTWATMLELVEKTAHVKAIRLAQNAGQQHAMTAGIENATGDAVVTMDTDLQHPPELILDLVKLWNDGIAIVQTVRLEDPTLSMFKRITSRLFGYVMGWLSGLDVRPGAADFRLLDRSAVNLLNKMQDNPRLMRAAVASLKLPTRYLDYHPRNRVAGVSKYGFKKMILLAMQGIWTYGHGIRTALKVSLIVGMVAGSTLIPALWFFRETGTPFALLITLMLAPLFFLSWFGLRRIGKQESMAFSGAITPRYSIDLIVDQPVRNPQEFMSKLATSVANAA